MATGCAGVSTSFRRVSSTVASWGWVLCLLLCVGGCTSSQGDVGQIGQRLTPSLALDKSVFTHQSSASTSITSPALTTTAAGDLLLAFIGSDGPSPGTQSVTGVTGGGLTWKLRKRSNAQAGHAEIWEAVASSVVTGATIKATRSSAAVGSIFVAAFTGADTTTDGVTGGGSAPNGAPTASLTTTRSGSWVWAVGNDWDNDIARTVGAGQTKDDEYLSTQTGDAFWVQHLTSFAGAAGTPVTINDTAPTADRWNLALVEILPLAVDTTPPSAPTNLTAQASSSARVDLSWSGSTDNVGVTGYQIVRGGLRIGTATTTSYSDTTVAANTTYSYVVTAVDAAGNVSAPSNTVTVMTPPAVAPPVISNIVVSGITDRTATIAFSTDRPGTTQINYGTTSTYGQSTALDSTLVTLHSQLLSGLSPAQLYHFQIRSTDASGSLGLSSDATFTCAADTNPPTVALTAPSSGATLSSTVSLTATATDDVGVISVQFSVDGSNFGAPVTAAPYGAAWDTTLVANGPHTIGVSAVDAAGNVGTANPVTVTVSNAGPAQVGQWGPLVSWPEVSIHQALTYAGKVLTWQGDFSQGGQQYVLDPVSGSYIQVPNAAVDLFCAGQAVAADGRILVIGGTSTSGGLGLRAVTAFDPASQTWSSLAPMVWPRWYATGTTLGDGRILATSGYNTGSGDLVTVPEVYNVQNNVWSVLSGANLAVPIYPFMYQLPDGRVLQAGASEVATPTRVLDLTAQTWQTVDANVVNGASIANYAPNKFMKCGSAGDGGGSGTSVATAFTLDMSAPSPSWKPTSSMAYPRSFVNLTNLPDGTVLATGGGLDGSGQNNANAVLPTERWDPKTGTWTTLASMSTWRLYHSGAVLLPDGRVFVSGSGGDTGVSDQKSYQIYSPPYLFQGARPTITSVPSTVQYGAQVFVQTPDGATIALVSLLRTGSVTHSFDQNARALSLSFSAAAGGLNITMPPDGNTAPPGYYMLFLVNGSGVPSVASFVRFPAPWEDTVPPTAPTNLVAAGGIGTVTLDWTAATDNVGVAGYNVHRATSSGFTPSASNRIATGVTGTHFVDTLAAGTYEYLVIAMDAAGNLGPPSNEATGTATADTTPPSAPGNLQAVASGLQVSLSWTASTDNVGVDHYGVVRNGSPLVTLPNPSTSYVDTAVVSGSSYSYVVIAYDAAGNASGPSGTASATVSASSAVSVDVQVATHQGTPGTTIVSPPITTGGANEVVVAFLASDALSSSLTFSGVSGGGLSFRLRNRVNVQFGPVEIWEAVAASPLSAVAFTATRSGGTGVGSIVVVAFTGASTTVDGAVGSGTAASGAPTATLTATRAGSLVWGVGNDWDNALARTVGAGQTKVDEDLGPTGDTYWVQRLTSPVPAAGTVVTVNDTQPAGDRYNLALIEIPPGP